MNLQAKIKKFFLITLLIFIIATILGVWDVVGKDKSPTSTPTPTPTSNIPSGFFLKIPSLDLSAPIIAGVNGNDQSAYDKALEGGVAQLDGSSLPGQGSNIFIFGHSSFYLFAPGDYKYIFKNLNELKIDDQIIIWYRNHEFVYRVSEKRIVSPNQVDVAKPTQEEQVSLMTCYPPGTTKLRLVVIAKRSN